MDNWIQGHDNMLCKACMWFKEKSQSTRKLEGQAAKASMQEEEPPKHLGRCRKHAPTLDGWPVMFGTDWCGDHKLDENKA